MPYACPRTERGSDEWTTCTDMGFYGHNKGTNSDGEVRYFRGLHRSIVVRAMKPL